IDEMLGGAAKAVAAHLRHAAVGVEHAQVRLAALVEGQLEHAVGADAAPPVAPALGFFDRHSATNDDDEVVLAGLIFRESNRPGAHGLKYRRGASGSLLGVYCESSSELAAHARRLRRRRRRDRARRRQELDE